MAVLARLQAQDADAATTTVTTLFVRCRQKALSTIGSTFSSGSGARLPALQLDVVEGDALWRGEVTEEHKPMVLDCSASEYLATLKAVFNARVSVAGNNTKRAFVYKWSCKSGVLTLMEESTPGFAMKYTSLSLMRVRDDDEKQSVWRSLMSEIVDVSAHATQEMTRQRTRIDALEKLLKEKDTVLETALQAKQQLEDQLFEGFCAVLNAKKDEIQRLQHEFVIAQMQTQTGAGGQSNGNPSAAAVKTKKARQPRVTKAKGAKLKRKAVIEDEDDEEGQGISSEEDEAESHDDASESQGEGDDDDDTGTDSKKGSVRSRRAKQDAFDAYSQLSSQSSQVRSADEMLDQLLKEEVAANDAILEVADIGSSSSRAKRPRASAPPARRAHETKKKRESEASSLEEEEAKSQENEAKPVPQAPPPRAAPVNVMDSEEEDLLDMLC